MLVAGAVVLAMAVPMVVLEAVRRTRMQAGSGACRAEPCGACVRVRALLREALCSKVYRPPRHFRTYGPTAAIGVLSARNVFRIRPLLCRGQCTMQSRD